MKARVPDGSKLEHSANPRCSMIELASAWAASAAASTIGFEHTAKRRHPRRDGKQSGLSAAGRAETLE